MIEKQLKFGDVVLIEVPFVEKEETKLRPALVLFEEFDNVVIAGITSNLKMDGIYLPKEEGLITDSIFKVKLYFYNFKNENKKKVRCSVQ